MSIRLALGVPGAGKTIALQDMAADACVAGHTVFVPDLAGEWGPTFDGKENPRWRGKPPPFLSAPEPGSKDLLEWLQRVRDDGGQLVLFPHPWEPRAVAELARDVGGVVYADDEIDLSATYAGWPDNPLRDFCHRGRHLPDINGVPREIHTLGAARRPQNLHTDITSLADEVLIFRVQGKATLKRLVEEGMLLEEHVEEARNLSNFEYFLWRSSGEISRGILEAPNF